MKLAFLNLEHLESELVCLHLRRLSCLQTWLGMCFTTDLSGLGPWLRTCLNLTQVLLLTYMSWVGCCFWLDLWLICLVTWLVSTLVTGLVTRLLQHHQCKVESTAITHRDPELREQEERRVNKPQTIINCDWFQHVGAQRIVRRKLWGNKAQIVCLCITRPVISNNRSLIPSWSPPAFLQYKHSLICSSVALIRKATLNPGWFVLDVYNETPQTPGEDLWEE